MFRILTGLVLYGMLSISPAAALSIAQGAPRVRAVPEPSACRSVTPGDALPLSLRLGRAVAAAGDPATLDSDCVWECAYCAGMWVGTGVVAGMTVATCPTVVGCIAGTTNVIVTLGAAVEACLECDRCLHPDPNPDPVPAPDPICPDGYAPCSPTSSLCCPLPDCPPGFEPCDDDPMQCCAAADCVDPSCPT